MRFFTLVCLIATLGGCDSYQRPDRPLPEGFELALLDGQKIGEGDLRAGSWVLSLWVPGCSGCVHELAELEAIRTSHESHGVGFLAVSLEPDPALVHVAMERLGILMPVAVAKGELLAPLSVNQVPSTVFVSNGRIAMAVSGRRSQAFFARRIAQLQQMAGKAKNPP